MKITLGDLPNNSAFYTCRFDQRLIKMDENKVYTGKKYDVYLPAETEVKPITKVSYLMSPGDVFFDLYSGGLLRCIQVLDKYILLQNVKTGEIKVSADLSRRVNVYWYEL